MVGLELGNDRKSVLPEKPYPGHVSFRGALGAPQKTFSRGNNPPSNDSGQLENNIVLLKSCFTIFSVQRLSFSLSGFSHLGKRKLFLERTVFLYFSSDLADG